MADNLPCGTVAAYRRHLRHSEQPCTACYAANAAYSRARADRNKTIRELVHVLACAMGVGRAA